MFSNNQLRQIQFTTAARKHKVGRARVRQVLARPIGTVELPAVGELPVRVLVVGEDWSGRVLEIIVVEEIDRLVVIHAMDLHRKFRWLYEQGVES